METVSAMTSISQGFQHLETKMSDQDREIPFIQSTGDIMKALKQDQKELAQDLKGLEKLLKGDVENNKNQNMQGELF